MTTTRRDFLGQGIGATTLLASGATLPGFLARTASAARPDRDERIFVVVQMSGGNDGLNTIVPFRDDAYHAARPTLAVGKDQALPLNDDLGFNPTMTGFKQLFDDGLLSVINNVGYPNPDRSHFRSMDIWHSASTTPEKTEDGWLGRVIDREAGNREPGTGNSGSVSPLALHLDDGPAPLALRARGRATPSIRDIEAFRLDEEAGQLEAAIAAKRGRPSDDLLFIQRTALASCANAKRLQQVARGGDGEAAYPDYGLARKLRQIGQLIGARFGPRIYYTSIGGFDTHAKQALSHPALLRELSDSIAAFFADLKGRKLADQVVLMTFSEFGRRVKENGSQGTDHGVGAPMFVAGPAVKPGLIGGPPDLSALTLGDVEHKIDFRCVYAALLADWIGVEPDAILGRRFEPLDILKSSS